jgi:hypothetical protein
MYALNTLVFIFLLSLSDLFAFDSGILRQIGDINHQNIVNVNDQCSRSLLTLSESSKKIKGPDYNDCAVGLCGTPEQNESVWLTDANFSKSIPSNIKKSIDTLEPTIEKIFEKAKRRNLTEVERLREIISHLSPDNINPSTFTPGLRDDLDSMVFGTYLQEIHNYTKPIAKRISFDINLPSSVSPEYHKAIKEYAEKHKEYIANQNLNYEDKRKFKKKEFFEFAQMQFKKMKNFIEENINKLKENEMSDSLLVLNEAKKTLDDSTDETFNLDDFFYKIEYIKNKISKNHPEIKSEFTRTECNSENCKIAYIEFINSKIAEKNLSNIAASLNDSKNKERGINHCKATLVSKLIQEADNQKSKSLFIEAKNDVIKNVLPHFSDHSRKILLDYLNNKLDSNPVNPRFREPDPVGDFKEAAEEYLSKDLEEKEEGTIKKNLMENITSTNINPFGSSFDYTPCSGSTATSWETFIPVSRLSPGELPPDLENSNGKDVIYISDFSCTHDVRGKAAIAHEIGHAISSIFANEKLSPESTKLFNKIRSCANDSYLDPQKKDTDPLARTGDFLHTDEDVADLISSMTYSNVSDLSSCALMNQSFDCRQYVDLEFIAKVDDSHTTSFSRAIIEAVNKGIELPVSCQRIITNDQPRMKFKKCILK